MYKMIQRLELRARANLFWAYREKKKSVDSIPCLVHLPDFSLAGPAQLVNAAADPLDSDDTSIHHVRVPIDGA